MAPLELEGTSLKEKHRHYNQLVKEAIESKTPLQADDFNSGENDIEHLIKIDVASHNRDVEYIINVLKCDDMLYVSRAIKKSTWLITDQQYSHIVNPTYLNAHLFPKMSASAKTKFMKHVRLHLKDEARAEQFFNNDVTSGLNVAVKWLPNCSEEFIILNASKYLKNSRNHRLFKRLCEKTPRALETLMQDQSRFIEDKLEAANFLLQVDLDMYLNVAEKQSNYDFPMFGIRTTHLLMQKCPSRIIDKFEKYCQKLHLPTFLTYLKPNDIKDFLLKQVMKKSLEEFFHDTKKVRYFIEAMGEEQRTQFLNQVFVQKIHMTGSDDEKNQNPEMVSMKKFYEVVTSRAHEYIYHDFNTAFDNIIKEIRNASSNDAKIRKLILLIECAGNDRNNIKTVLNYYHEKHMNDPRKSQETFLKHLLPKINISQTKLESWSKLEDLFKQMEILTPTTRKYTDKATDVDSDKNSHESSSNDEGVRVIELGKSYSINKNSGCAEIILLYKVINDEKVPEEIEKRFYVNCVKSLAGQNEQNEMKRRLSMLIKSKKVNRNIKIGSLELASNSLNDQDKEKVFRYIFNGIVHKINNLQINKEDNFKHGVSLIELALFMLANWKQDHTDFLWVLDKIKEYVKLKNNNSWKTSMARIYNMKRSFKKPMFDMSIQLCPSQAVCLNALKHDNRLLSLDREEVNTIRCNEKVCLQRLLNKLRVYWPRSLAANWTQRYVQEITQSKEQKANVRALCSLLPRQQLLELVNNYAPKQSKIDFKEIDEITLNVQRQLAKNMHFARPRPPPDAILLFAKGDYLQFALPSLLAIFNNASSDQTGPFITQLLYSPVSIQKHGIRIAFAKLRPEEAVTVFRDVWMNTKNSTIRAVVFHYTFSLLSKVLHLEKDIWESLFLFIDNLSLKEDNKIYNLILDVKTLDKVPNYLKGEFLRIVNKFLMDLIPTMPDRDQKNYEWRKDRLIERTTEFMEHVPMDFMVNWFSKFIDEEFLKKRISFRHGAKCSKTKVLSAFVLCTKAEKTQLDRYNQFLLPFLNICISSWDQELENEYFIRCNVDELLNHLILGLKVYMLPKKMDIPLNIFEEIQKTLNQLPVPENYILLTKWKLTVEIVKILDSKGFNSTWDDICVSLAPEFGNKCLEILKNDVTSYFPCIYVLFSKALSEVLKNMPDVAKFTVYETLLKDVQFLQAYLAVVTLCPERGEESSSSLSSDEEDSDDVAKKVRRIISEHSSVEVKMHYNHKFKVNV